MPLFVNPFLSSFFTISLFSSLLVDLFVIPTIKSRKNKIIFKKKKDFLNLCRIYPIQVVLLFLFLLTMLIFHLNNLFYLQISLHQDKRRVMILEKIAKCLS